MIAAATAAQAAATVQKVSTNFMVIKFCYVIPVHSFKKLHMHVLWFLLQVAALASAVQVTV